MKKNILSREITKKRFIFYLFIMDIILVSQVMAGSFAVRPFKVFLESKKTTALKVRNTGEEKVTIQIMAVAWRQDEEGQDRFEPTKEIIFFPKILSIEPEEERVVRIGYRGEWPKVERAYRLFLRELPLERPGKTAIKIALELSIPLFISPIEKVRKTKRIEEIEIEKVSIEEMMKPPKRKVEVEGEETRSVPSKKMLVVRVRNRGNRHLIIKKVEVIGLDGPKREIFFKEVRGQCILAGVSKPFVIEMSPEEYQGSELIKVKVETERSSVEAEWQVNSEE
ncbi:TPA: hypothetical protein DCX15_06310 [bacterium]|nr:hypothetical protein [bacterium]